MKTLQSRLKHQEESNPDDPITKELIKETYDTFGMTRDEIDDVNAMVAEEGDIINN